ncbi:hypothetical protein AX17_002566 [Amanita inopinata Kibby_2008]|nr:hypothetical protein AX17_002566 [Amanita inopinata Kibby_2008]
MQQEGPSLSTRGESQAEVGKLAVGWEKIAIDSYDPESNPNGIVNLGIAENTLIHKQLTEYFHHNFRLAYKDFTYGDSFSGSSRLRRALSGLLNTRFKPHTPVTPQHIVLGAGLTPIIGQLSRSISNPGDGILLATPYYQGFDLDLPVQNDITPVGVPVPISDMFTPAELTYFEKALQESNEKGTTIKAVILCNPHNPLGRSYPPEVIVEYFRFCEKHNLHLISDEIYALSVFPSRDVPNPQPFVSALSFDLKEHGINVSRVHVLYGMSKDFNANGFRLGALVSQANPALMQSMMIAAVFMMISSPASSLWTTLLSDEPFLSHFIETNQLALREAYEYMTSWLRFHNIPYIPSSAGHFLLADMRPVLSDVDRYGPLLPIGDEQDMRQREAALAELLMSHKVAMVPGAHCHMDAGWFRVTFSVRKDYVDVALARIENALGWERWPELSKVNN